MKALVGLPFSLPHPFLLVP